MGLWQSAKKQLLDVIDWTEPSDDILAYRFPIADNEIQSGAQLTVRETQVALFVDQGTPADQFGPGRHKLVTANLPVLTKLKSWPYGFNSPFKSEVYFYSLRQKLAQKWGTPQPIAVRDREFGSVQLRMFGIFSYHIQDAPTFYRQISGTRESYRTEDLVGHLAGHIAPAAATVFAQSGVPFLDMAANQMALGAAMHQALTPILAQLGLALDAFTVESVNLPETLQKALSERQAMGIIGSDLGAYARYQTARSIPDAAQNPSGLAGLGAGIGVGAGFGQMMGNAMAGMAAPAAAQKACGNCKAVAAADAAFCARCGTKL
jgi:membrane protease subunit (stomatin/prohibitin family)